MSYTAEREYHVLQALVTRPGLIDAADLTASTFSREKHRSIFKALADIWENEKPETSDIIQLAEKSGLPVAEVAAFLGGALILEPEQFARQVGILKKYRAAERALKISLAEGETILKTGEIDLGKIAELRGCWEEIEASETQNSKNGAFDPMTIMKTGSELQALDIHIDWAVESLIPEDSLTLLYGPGGSGKTWLSLAIAKAVSEGVPFLGLAVKKRPVVYIDFENPRSVVIDRVRKLDVRDVRFWTLADDPCPPKLDDSGWTQYRDLPPGSVLFFDTARASQSGDENSSQDVALVMNRLKEIRSRGHEIVLQHHTVKINDRGFKGSTAWSDLADHTLAFHAVEPSTLEETDADPDPGALLALGTGRKTRFDHFKLFLTRDPNGPGYVRASSPGDSALDALAEYISGEGAGHNQSEIITWAKGERVGPAHREAFVALLHRGEKEGRYRSYRIGVRRFYEPQIKP